MIPGHSYHAFHKMLPGVNGIVKNDHVAAPDLLVRHHPIANASTVAELVHQQVVADQQRVFHRLGRNLEGLHGKGDDEHGNHHGCQKGLRGRKPARCRLFRLEWNEGRRWSKILAFDNGLSFRHGTSL